MESAKLVLLCIAVVCGFGACLGEASALVCPEAFTLGRPPSFGDLPALVLGPLWGVIDFVYPGAVIGLALAMAAHVGNRPAVKAFFFVKPLLAHAVLLAVISVASGVIGWFAVRDGAYPIIGPLRDALPPDQHPLLGAVWWARFGAHAANIVGGIAIATWIWRKRAVFERMVRGKA
jgi:hypothetical protein